MTTVEENYRGFRIDVEQTGLFHAYKIVKNGVMTDSTCFSETMKGLKQKIDRIRLKAFKKPCLVLVAVSNFGGIEKQEFVEAKVTSVQEYSSGWKQFHVAYLNGRETLDCAHIYKDTPKNRKLLVEIVQLNHKCCKLREMHSDLEGKLEHFEEKELLMEKEPEAVVEKFTR